MEPDLSWTGIASGIVVLVLGLVTGIGGILGYKRISDVPSAPNAVHATMMDRELLVRLVQSFESLARCIDANNNVIVENSKQLRVNTAQLQDIQEHSERIAKGMRDLTYELENRK